MRVSTLRKTESIAREDKLRKLDQPVGTTVYLSEDRLELAGRMS